MSLETVISENTTAIRQLIEVWAKLVTQGVKASDAVDKGKPVTAGGKPIGEAGKAAADATNKPSGASTASSSKANESAAGENRDAMSKAIVSLAAKTDRETAMAVLKPFGATSGKTVKDEDVDAVLAAVNEALAAAEMG